MHYFLTTLACATCVGDADDATTKAANMAILFMLVLLIPMLGGLMSLIIFFGRREKAYATVDDDPQGHNDPRYQ